MRICWLPAACGLLLLALVASAAAPPAVNEQDDEEREYQAMVARRAMQENCLICHSEEMISTQRLTTAQWKAEVEKMVGWGAPLPQELQQPLIDYLSSRYSDQTARVRSERTTYAKAWDSVRPVAIKESKSSDQTGRAEKLFAVNCASCHGNDAQGAELGPNLVEKAILLRPVDYDGIVRKGLRRMPGFEAVLKPADEADLLAWLRQRRYVPPPPK
jgi:mono/diheme cytochrome c family protein